MTLTPALDEAQLLNCFLEDPSLAIPTDAKIEAGQMTVGQPIGSPGTVLHPIGHDWSTDGYTVSAEGMRLLLWTGRKMLRYPRYPKNQRYLKSYPKDPQYVSFRSQAKELAGYAGMESM